MSVWAQSWAYEQRLGKWRETKGGKEDLEGGSGGEVGAGGGRHLR